MIIINTVSEDRNKFAIGSHSVTKNAQMMIVNVCTIKLNHICQFIIDRLARSFNTKNLVNFNNIDSISLSIGLNLATSNNLSPALSLSVSESKVIVQTNESANQIVESKGIGNSSGVVLTVSPIVAQNIESSIANSGLASLALTINGQFIAEPSTAGTNLNNAINALINSSDLAMAEIILPTALNDALDAISQINPVVEPGDNSRIANVARALHEIKINSLPGLKTNF